MIVLEEVTKTLRVAGRGRTILSSVNLIIPSNRRIALLGSSDRDKVTLIEALAGAVQINAGRIVRKANLSFPVGHLPGFTSALSIRFNVAFVAQIYGLDPDEIVPFVENVMDIGAAFDRPFRELPAGNRVPLGQVVALSLPFDAYLFAEDKLRGADYLRKKSWALFEQRAQSCGMIIPTNDEKFARKYCDMALVLHRGQVFLTDTVDEGLALAGRMPAEARY